ncbi:hypothetical protein FDP56_15515, partial [Enterococcus casseliflavus]|nr:hypothetical protein [Enterococcus casseliflavus]
NLSQNVVHSDPDLILHNSSVLIDKEPKKEQKRVRFCSSINQIKLGLKLQRLNQQYVRLHELRNEFRLR